MLGNAEENTKKKEKQKRRSENVTIKTKPKTECYLYNYLYLAHIPKTALTSFLCLKLGSLENTIIMFTSNDPLNLTYQLKKPSVSGSTGLSLFN